MKINWKDFGVSLLIMLIIGFIFLFLIIYLDKLFIESPTTQDMGFPAMVINLIALLGYLATLSSPFIYYFSKNDSDLKSASVVIFLIGLLLTIYILSRMGVIYPLTLSISIALGSLCILIGFITYFAFNKFKKRINQI
jgi:hypothetical protein